MSLDTIFLVAAVIGGTVLVCQFALTLLGLGDHGTDLAGDFHGDAIGDFHGDVAGDFHGDAHLGGDFHGDGALGDSMHGGFDHHPTSLATASDANYLHPDSTWLFSVLSFRTLVAALAFFGVSGKAALSAGYAQSTSLVLATLVGLCAMYGMYWLLRLISGLTSSGNERIGNALGKQATVYIPIPPAGKGAGKVQLSMQNRIVEFQAVTEDDQPLKTGQAVQVVGIANSDTVQVRRAQEAVSS